MRLKNTITDSSLDLGLVLENQRLKTELKLLEFVIMVLCACVLILSFWR
ncbi:hypothetical protein UFOVP591_28 [uncultured Caudovirales phage]|uniref:Uncharacterized protein n=1 Tax=uncultured Caudovirales phage TaxID=2100421 RepID=A0A6J5MYL1_9CAUD|nr:hypothetical protein UFOVP591_28 [uncultured Caudovirales phage]